MEVNVEKLKNMFDLSGKVAVVTGGTGVLGEAVCTAYAAYGSDVVIVDGRPIEDFKKVIEYVEKEGRKAYAFSCDVTDEEKVIELVSEVKVATGGVDILFNAAGFANRHAAEDFPVDEFRQIMDVNILGTFIPCKYFFPIMKERGEGKIINVSSVRGYTGHTGGYAPYAASKAGIINLTRQLAAEWGQYNINVNAIGPTVFRSPLNTQIFENPELKKTFTDRIRLGRFAERDDMLGAVIFLASGASDFITGVTLFVDGGCTAN